MAADRTPFDFARCMAGLGPFEASPDVAVACSGGADSMALALLADRWARDAGGRATALIVDHGMRSESAREAEQVRLRLDRLGIAAVVLTRQGPKPESDRQAAARRARYALLSEWCRSAGVLHLLLGHHRGDQAETFMLRLGRGSGVSGLAAMAPVGENEHVRLLRPLLEVPRDALAGYLRARQVDWVEDPTNDDTAYARVRMRRLLPGMATEGLTEARLAATARRMARARIALEAAATDLLARIAAIYPEGYATLRAAGLLAAPEEVALRALARLLACIGGAETGPRLEGLEGLYRWLSEGPGTARTFAGCRIARRGGGQLLFSRELAAMDGPVAARPGAVWDGRFRLLATPVEDGTLGPLGAAGWARLELGPAGRVAAGLPATVRNAIPAVARLEEIVSVPHLRYRGLPASPEDGPETAVTFLPPHPLGAARFSAVPG